MGEAEQAYLEALEIRRKLAKIHVAYKFDVAHSLHNLGVVYQLTQRSEEAEKTYQESLEIYRKLAKIDSARYGAGVERILRDLGSLYYTSQRYEDAVRVVIEADNISSWLKEQKGSLATGTAP